MTSHENDPRRFRLYINIRYIVVQIQVYPRDLAQLNAKRDSPAITPREFDETLFLFKMSLK